MSKATKHVQAFIALNKVAFTAAGKVFTQIEAQSDVWAEALAKAGIMGPDIKVYAVMWVSEQSGVAPKDGQRGLTFNKGTEEYNRVEYLVNVATGKAAAKAAKRKSSNVTDPVEALLKKYAELTAAQKRSFKAKI
jgi:hypothetical protein